VTGPLLALGASLTWGVGDFLAGLRSRSLPVLTVLVVSQAAGFLTIALVVAARGTGPPDARYLGYAVLAGLCGAAGLAALYRGLAVGDMSVVAPISATAAVVPVIAGLVSGERPSVLQGLGVALALAGVALTAHESGTGGGGPATGVGLALVAALSFGLVLVALGAASEGDALWGTLSMRSTSFSTLVVAALLVRPGFALRDGALPALVLIGILDVAGTMLFAVASTKSLLSLAAVLAQLYPVVTVLLARVVLGERISRHQQLGVVAVFAGVVLITAA
jgi:drug/metabolite transporter (DMT)-like permease